ncbi:amidohydrolase family protein [Novosphingobium sp. TH158]|uniref:amidohydrolase family protein n=1 Tax=Novosphingobium sp. TH158 TaxID=2067455 RepID=UPI000C7CDC18|nr:amidohydrolase family protein [Novosphingobium sp. TH158]PLK26958.1 hydrolase [Novosphingobium sp. TH158]
MTDLATLDRPLAELGTWTLGEIVDADAHIDPPYDMWQEYLPAHLRAKAPVIEEGDECDWIVFEGTRRPVRMINNQAGRTGKDFKMVGKLSEQRAVWDPHVRLADMDADGIGQAVLFGGGPLGTLDDELYMASYEAYQRWVMDWCAANPARLHPIGYVPMRDIDETIGHVERLAKMGFKAINLPAFPQNPKAWETSSNVANMKAGQVSALTGDPQGELQYYLPEFDRLWAVIQDHDLAITMHLGGRVPRFGDAQHFLPDMPMSKMAMAEPIGIFLFNAIFQRFPKLRIGMIESGVGWMAWYTEYVTRTWEKQRFWTKSPLTQSPAFYMDRNVYGSFIQDRTGILCRNLPGGRNIMWSSDYPHSETTFPKSREIILRDFDGIPEAETQDIICNIAKRFFNLA